MRILRITLECLTPLHCGGGGEDPVQDQPVIRDAFGLWRIPGSSIAGSLRSLSERLNPAMCDRLFGDKSDDDEKSQASLVWCDDAVLLDFDGQIALDKKLAGQKTLIPLGPFIRDHVCLDLQKGSAVKGAKFDMEIVPAGARFQLAIRCDGWNRELDAEEKAHFDQLCALILAGELELGGKSANAYGRYKVLDCQYGELLLTDPDDMQSWLNLPRYGAIPLKADKILPLSPRYRNFDAAGLNGSLEFPLVCDEPILIGGGNPILPDGRVAEADMLFALSPFLDYQRRQLLWRPVIPSSSIKGVLRHAIYGILRDQALDDAEARRKLDRLFGYVDGDKGQCGKLSIEDCPLEAGKNFQFIQHVAIDSFSGGALAGALFSEEPVWLPGLLLRLRLSARDLNAEESELLFQLLLDLGQGLLSIGNGVNRGNGRLKAKDAASVESILALIQGRLAWKDEEIFTGDGAARLSHLRHLSQTWSAQEARS